MKLSVILTLCTLSVTAQVNDERPNTAEDFASKYGKVVPSIAQLGDSVSYVTKVPISFKFSPFYQKYLNASGIPIIGSADVSDEAFYKTREIVLMMLSKSPMMKAKMIENNSRIAIIGKNQELTDMPEYNQLDKSINNRARGLGGWIDFPLTSCGEENILGLSADRYKGEDILIHEFAHAIHMLGIIFIDTSFNDKLKSCYTNAINQGLWKDTYAISSQEEYFAEGVQSWFNVNDEAKKANGIHNEINTYSELELYDPHLHKLISSYFKNEKDNKSVHFKKKVDSKWMQWDLKP